MNDERRRLQGKLSREKGKRFESLLDATFEYYSYRGFAEIEKTPEPMKPIKDLGNGRFIACYEKRAQPDYKGVIKGGRELLFEAKFTSSDRMDQSRVTEGQATYLSKHEKLGARCYVIIGFSTGGIYRLPWAVWNEMKTHFGRKYVKEDDLDSYKVELAWNGIPLIL